MRMLLTLFAAALSCAAAFETQLWTYNSTLWWAPLLLHHPLRGPLLAALADQLTELVYSLFEVAKATCMAPSGPCHGEGTCNVAALQLALTELRSGFDLNAEAIVSQLPTAYHAAAKMGSFEPCGDLLASLDDPTGPCEPLALAVLHCARRLSARARVGFARLHAQQIGELAGETVLGVPLPPPPATRFHEELGLDRAEVLTSLLGDVPARAAELGVDDGRTSEALLSRLPSLQLLLVDPYEAAGEGYFVREPTRGIERAAGALETTWARLAPFRNRSVLVCQQSAEAAAWVAPESLDLVFVDGDHAYEAVAEDMRSWTAKLKPRGVLAGHDYSLFRPGVVRAVHEYAVERGLQVQLGADHMWWLWL